MNMAQSRFITIATSERSEIIYEQVKAKSRIKKVNAMLRALKKEGLYDESIAVENIFNFLDTSPLGVDQTKSGYISVRGLSGKSVTQLTGINKAISEFIKNKTSTVSGMRELYEERRNELARFIEDGSFLDALSYKDIRDIYKVFQSNEYKKLQSRMGSPEFFTLMTQSIDEKWSKDRFQKEMEYYLAEGNDEDLKGDIGYIYDIYIKNFVNR
jgi:hypothetical protein